jgi:flagellar protein FliO/FliZ
MSYEADSLSSLTLGVGVIVILLWAALWWLRRTRPNGFTSRTEDCKVIRSLALGPREKLLVVAIGTRQLVVGVGTAAISQLGELDEPLSPIAPANTGFGEAVRKARERWHGG